MPLYIYHADNAGSLSKAIDVGQFWVWKQNLAEKEKDCMRYALPLNYNSFYRDFLQKFVFYALQLSKVKRYDIIGKALHDSFMLKASRFTKELQFPFKVYYFFVRHCPSVVLAIHKIWATIWVG